MLALEDTSDQRHLTMAVARHHPDLLRRARQLVGRDEADDLVQNTVEKALRNLGTFTPETNLLAWLRRIMGNLLIDEWRRQKRRQPTVSLDGDKLPAPAASGDEPPPPPPPWQRLTRDDVLRAVPALTRYVRPVFALHLQGLSYRQIATRLGLRPATVGTRLLRARLQLRRLLAMTILERENDPANDGGTTDIPRDRLRTSPPSATGRPGRPANHRQRAAAGDPTSGAAAQAGTAG